MLTSRFVFRADLAVWIAIFSLTLCVPLLSVAFPPPRDYPEVYWFDDTGVGERRLPESWQLFCRGNGEWRPASHPNGYGCEGDRYNRTTTCL